jgi:hypothetical protein
MDEHVDIIDCDSGKDRRLQDEATAVRYAAGRHAATRNIVEVVRTTPTGAAQLLVLPPSGPLVRP